MTVYGGMRDLVWILLRGGLRNPDWPPRVRSLLFACYANLCRSPFAGALAERLLMERGITDITCSSAGFVVFPGTIPPPEAVAAAAAHGVSIEGRPARPLTLAEVEKHDAVFVMEPEQFSSVRRRWPAFTSRFFLLPRFGPPPPETGAYERDRIIDPFGQSPEVFTRCYDRLAVSVEAVVDLCAAAAPAEAEADVSSR
jgi:protein-tyrosine-phosphatase